MPGHVEVTVEVFGAPVIRRRLLRAGAAATDASAAFRRIAGLLDHAAEQQFATSGAYGGAAWAPLAPSPLAAKARAGLDPRILRATHELMNSLVDRGDSQHIEEIGPRHLRWGSKVQHGIYHQPDRQGRVVFRLPEQDRRSAVREIQRSLFGGVTARAA